MKPGFTLDEHAEMGAMLAAIHDELTRRATRTANTYPGTMQAARKLRHASEALLRARGALDDAMCTEFPGEFSTTAYFPNTEDRQRLSLSPSTDKDSAA